jgi:hypothetical protein
LLGEVPPAAAAQQQQIEQQAKQIQQQQIHQQNNNPPQQQQQHNGDPPQQQQQQSAMVSPFAAFAGTAMSPTVDRPPPSGSSNPPSSSSGLRISTLTQQLRTSPVARAPAGTSSAPGVSALSQQLQGESALSQQVQALVKERCLLPVLQCLLQRREFAMPFDDTVRVALETDVVMAVPPVSDWDDASVCGWVGGWVSG